VIDEKRMVFRILRNGFTRVQGILSRYDSASSRRISTIGVSRELSELFKPLERYYTGKDLVIIISDDDLESVPFEIIGRQIVLDESHTIVYLSSILSALRRYNSGNREVSLIDADSREIYHELELVALRETGISFKSSDRIDSGIGHIHSTVLFNPVMGEFFLDEMRYRNLIRAPEIIYLPSAGFVEQRGYNDFTLFSSLRGIRAVVINDARIHDVNNAIFVDTLYGEMVQGKNLIEAFKRAKRSIRDSGRYSHPAYWAGIRLYLNGL
jgi:hypothetical protein